MTNDLVAQINKFAVKAAAKKIEDFLIKGEFPENVVKDGGKKLMTPIVQNALHKKVEPLDILKSIHEGTLEAQKK